MADSTLIETQIAQLRAAIATGVVETYYGDKRVRFRSLDEMKTILADLEGQVAAASGVNRRRRFAAFNNGLYGCEPYSRTHLD